MPSYQYDPQGSFRGWLRRLCHHRAINLYHECRDNRCFSLGEDDLIDARLDEPRASSISTTSSPARSRLLEEALEVQKEIRRKVKPSRWEAFWRVVIEGESMSEVAAALGLKYATAYAGVNHVARLLRQEGRRRRAGLGCLMGPIREADAHVCSVTLPTLGGTRRHRHGYRIVPTRIGRPHRSVHEVPGRARRRVDQGLDTATGPAMSLPDHAPRIPGYTIERELGRGGMGIVYLANCDRPRRRVALKLLPGGRRASSRERRQWLREAEEASLVRHSHVVTLYDVGEADDWFFLVLEYIPGGTLADRLSNPLLPADAAALIETVARAVHCVHLHGQLHLDLKPSNILLDGDAGAGWEALVPKVSDFGIARSGESTATSTVEPVARRNSTVHGAGADHQLAWKTVAQRRHSRLGSDPLSCVNRTPAIPGSDSPRHARAGPQ